MSTQENVQTVKDFFAAMGGGDKQRLLALAAEDIEWIIPGEDWPLARHAPRARGIGGCSAEGFRRG
jgi:ketosteroid isomerase-like protein